MAIPDTPSLLQATVFIKLYLEERGYPEKRCFTYRGLRAWWQANRKYEGSEWHTVERSIRRLAELGYLKRVRKGKRVVFCVEPMLEEEFHRIDSATKRPDFDAW